MARLETMQWARGKRPVCGGGSGTASDVSSEAEAVGAVLAGRREAFEGLVSAHWRRVFGHIWRLVGDVDQAEDLTQETFVRAFENLGRFDKRRPFRPWVLRIATNLAISSLRKGGEKMASLDHEGAPERADEKGGDPRRAAERSEQAARLERALGGLSAKNRALISLYYDEELSVAEVATAMNLTPGAAKVAIYRARGELRAQLEAQSQEKKP